MASRAGRIGGIVAATLAIASCGSVCGLGLRQRTNVRGTVLCCGASTFSDVALSAESDTEFDLASTEKPTTPGTIDAFLVPTSCTKLFDGPYPGATPLCQVFLGPAATGKVSSRKKLASGPYRIWLQAYTSNTGPVGYLIDIDTWNHDCRSPLIQ